MSEVHVVATPEVKPNFATWAGLWWGHAWRYFWRGLLLVVAFFVVFMAAGALVKVLSLPGALFLFLVMPVCVVVFFWWCFKNYIYALDAMMEPGISFGGYQLRFINNTVEESVTTRLRAMRWLSWGMIWRNGLWAIPVAIVDEFYGRIVLPSMLPPDPSPMQVSAYYSPMWVVAIALYAVIWVHVLKGRLGKEIKGYTLYLLPDVQVAEAPAVQSQWGGKQ